MLELMGNISELVYVADLETYELLYVNQSGKERFNLAEDLDGIKCHKAFQNTDEPCSFCTNALLTKDENYTWEITNPVSNRHYLLKDRLIDWNGRLARLEVAFDITESEDEKRSLRDALEAEQTLLRCIKQLHNTEGIDAGIENVVSELGKVLAAEKAVLYTFADDLFESLCEWRAPMAAQQSKELAEFDPSTFSEWSDSFFDHECIVVEDIERIKQQYPDEYCLLKNQGIRGIVVVPLVRDKRLVGLLIATNPSASSVATASTLLVTLQYFLASALCRLEDERRLKALGFRDMLTGLSNRNRYIEDSARIAQNKEPLGVLYLDLNGLKEINDRHGHAQGNAALMYCAEILKKVLPEAALYRVGGDEFVALYESVPRKDFFERVEQLRSYFSETSPFSAAVGARWTDGTEGIESLVSSADINMYEDKRRYYRAHFLSEQHKDGSEEDSAGLELARNKEYEMLMDSLRVSISKHLLREDLFLIWANDRFYELIGYSQLEFFELFGGHINQYFKDDRNEFDRICRVVLEAYNAGKKSYESIMYVPQKDGSYIWISLVGTFTDEMIEGVPVVYTVFTDITDLVEAEKERGIAFDALPGFCAKFRVSADRPYLLASNERFANFFGAMEVGVSSESLLDCLEANWSIINQYYSSLRAGEPISFEIDAKGVDGQYARFQITANCVNILEGDPIYLVVFLDISELRENQAELERVAYVDPITQGPNRLRFSIDAERAIQSAPPDTYVLASLDIHRFKVINDLFGINAGDRTLAHVFRVLESHLVEGEY
ncbi:MAG: diguanylate cyclase, partial [Raoultibacter sp.]